MKILSKILRRKEPQEFVPENPKLDIETLSLIKNKIEMNKAEPKDYETLNYFLSVFGYENFILDSLKEYDIHSYDEYILERKKSFEIRNRHVNGLALGTILGGISVLEKYITNKIPNLF